MHVDCRIHVMITLCWDRHSQGGLRVLMHWTTRAIIIAPVWRNVSPANYDVNSTCNVQELPLTTVDENERRTMTDECAGRKNARLGWQCRTWRQRQKQPVFILFRYLWVQIETSKNLVLRWIIISPILMMANSHWNGHDQIHVPHFKILHSREYFCNDWS